MSLLYQAHLTATGFRQSERMSGHKGKIDRSISAVNRWAKRGWRACAQPNRPHVQKWSTQSIETCQDNSKTSIKKKRRIFHVNHHAHLPKGWGPRLAFHHGVRCTGTELDWKSEIYIHDLIVLVMFPRTVRKFNFPSTYDVIFCFIT